MQKIIMTKGLPASGKTTWAKEQVAASKGLLKRINKDDLRAMLDLGKWSKENEKNLVSIRNAMVTTTLANGFDVILDDTNFDYHHKQDMEKILFNFNLHRQTVEIEEKSFLDVPIQTCIARDLARGDKAVGTKVIVGMYEKYIRPTLPKPPAFSGNLRSIAICDLDGTIANMDHRDPYDCKNSDKDEVNMHVALILGSLLSTTVIDHVLFVSGRDECCREATNSFLEKKVMPIFQECIGKKWIVKSSDFALLMRADDDKRRDSLVKRDIYEKQIRGKYNVLVVLDDRPQVINETWRALGLPVLENGRGYDF